MSNRIFSAFAAAAALCALPAQAQPPAPPAGRSECLRLGRIDSFSAIKGNDRAFVVTDLAHRRYKVNLMYRCGGLNFNMAVGFKTLETGPLACVSRGDTVISRDPTRVGNRCPIASVVPYTPAMEAADRAAAATKPR